MKILIDCTQITKDKAGVGVYALNLVTELASCYTACGFIFLVQDDDPDFAIDEPNVTLIKVNSKLFRKLSFRFLMEQSYIPWLCMVHRVDVVHSLHYSFPLLPMSARKVVTVHDLTSIKMPNVHTRVKLAYFRFFLNASRGLANRLLFVSQSTMVDYLQLFPRDPATCHVTPLGVGDEFHPIRDDSVIEDVLERYGVTRPYVLFLGTIEPRKNIARLIESFALLESFTDDLKLVIAGKKGWMYGDVFPTVLNLGLEKRVIFTDFVREADKPALICGSTVFAYPSLYEGFGIPVLEALACGVPSLTSRVSSLPEVAGEAALLVNPTDIGEMTRALNRLLSDEPLREELRLRGPEQASRFTWSVTAHKTYSAYNK